MDQNFITSSMPGGHTFCQAIDLNCMNPGGISLFSLQLDIVNIVVNGRDAHII